MFIEIELEHSAVDQFIKILSIGAGYEQGGRFSQELMKLPLRNGAITTFWPDGLDPKMAHNYYDPRPYLRYINEKGEVGKKLIEKISRYLSGGKNRYAIFEDEGSVGDGWMKKRNPQYITVQGSIRIYLIERGVNFNYEQINSAIRFARYYPFVCCLTSLPGHIPLIEPNEDIPDSLVETLASRADSIIIDAYDGVGWWIWSMDNSPMNRARGGGQGHLDLTLRNLSQKGWGWKILDMIKKIKQKIRSTSTINLLGLLGFAAILIPFVGAQIAGLFLDIESDIGRLFVGLPLLLFLFFSAGLIGFVLIVRKEFPLHFATIKGLGVVIIGYLVLLIFWGLCIVSFYFGLVAISKL